ncbi:glycosyl transferase, family 2 [Actinokineospora spheciospongiae]|uniref:Glycosyl transferase, family 2 n=1 Tax=Actinokineospora spheciospongiae TaxID=909613 RepID=W7J6S5_9PSEU|nr:glycosyltransferase [Actinokineospora spheciospongiae]EWC61754.1 glycosyl transferase, family 2 [Actinokineospora spheciospongiae]
MTGSASPVIGSPMIDIVMPYYGDVALMQAAVRSVLAQDDPNWRLTVVDDGTAEGVPEWFAGLGDDRVRYQRNEVNLGVTGNFNKCLALAEHERVVILGCDDLLLPNYVGLVRAVHAEHPGAGIIQPGVRVIDGSGAEIRTLVDEAKRRVYAPKVRGRLLLSGEDLAVSLLRGDWLYFPSLCWKTEAIQAVGFPEHLKVIQDLALLVELVRRGESLVVDETTAFCYRRHASSESSWSAADGSRFTEAGRFFTDTADRMAEHGWPRAAGVARRHVSSRIFALTMLPQALRQRAGVGPLTRHVFGSGRRP